MIGVSGVLIALPDLALLGFSQSNLVLDGVSVAAILLCLTIEVIHRQKQLN